jgi:hypothetical protein
MKKGMRLSLKHQFLLFQRNLGVKWWGIKNAIKITFIIKLLQVELLSLGWWLAAESTDTTEHSC